MKTIFVFAYYSYSDPVFQSAVLPYLKLVKSDDLRFVVLTWEQAVFKLNKDEIKSAKKELLKHNIIWHKTRWHSGRFKRIKKAFDFTKGLLISLFFIIKYRASKIYSEGFPGAIFGHYLSIITNRKHVIHTFEPHSDYMKDAGVWTSSSWEYRLLNRLEKPIAKRAEYIITATQAYKEVIEQKSGKKNVLVIPSCIDLEQFKFDDTVRNQIRNQLKIKEHQIVITYLGKLGGMYMEDELFQFFQLCLNSDSERFHFFLFTNADQDLVKSKLEQFKIPTSKILVRFLQKGEVADYLSASDIGFCGVRPIMSQQYSSPIKTGEYWASGLYTLLPKGVSEDWKYLSDDLGLVFNNIDKSLVETLIKQNQIQPFYKRRNEVVTKLASLRSIKNYKSQIEKLFH